LYQRNFDLAQTVTEVFQALILFQVMPLENNMKSPRHFLGLGGVLNQGMAGVTLIYILLGFLGYLKYGETTEGSITLNLPVDEM
jgi:proton-coupled amino acid transporter